MGWDGWINKHIYSGETLAPRGIPRERNRVESPNTTKEEEKKRTTEGKDTMLHFFIRSMPSTSSLFLVST